MKNINQTVGVTLIIITLVTFILPLFAQQSYTYRFSDSPFNSVPPGGPALEPIGVTVTPVTVTIPTTTCADSPTIDLTYFEKNSGFKAKAFFTGQYSIEMIFKFEELEGYNRIIDFSNSISDRGIYTLNDCLNFYPTGNIGLCPGAFDTSNYKQLVITRNGVTDEMNVYLNGSLFTTHIDSSDFYVIGAAPNDSIKFFKDDLAVTNEASPGYVALIRMTDFVLSPMEVVTSYNNFCNRLTAIHESSNLIDFNIFPNPAKDRITIQLSNSDLSKGTKLTLVNTTGQKIREIPIYTELTIICVDDIISGAYFYQLHVNNAIIKNGQIIIE